MIKKICLLSLILTISLSAFANYNDIYIADISYDWINKNELEKEAIINEVSETVFENPVTSRTDLKSLFKDRLKDKNYRENYNE